MTTAPPPLALPPGWSLDHRAAVDSTNALARREILAGRGRDRLILRAERQTAGRGRAGRPWDSPPGNLHVSLMLRSGAEADPARCAEVSFIAAVALADAIEALCPQADPRCKWPNDIICHGGKVAGILLERVVEDAPAGTSPGAWLVLGIGVNLATAPPTEALFPALSLQDLGCGPTADSLLERLAGAVESWLVRWRDEGFAPVRDAWLTRALGLGAAITVRLSPNQSLEGRFEGLDPAGHLILLQSDGHRRQIAAGDVFFPQAGGA